MSFTFWITYVEFDLNPISDAILIQWDEKVEHCVLVYNITDEQKVFRCTKWKYQYSPTCSYICLLSL